MLLCTKLDRLARSVADLVKLEERLKAKGASICIMDPAMDTGPPNGRLMFNVIAAIAQFERQVMLSRQREGIAKAKSDQSGVRATDVAKQLGIGRRSVYRIIEASKA